MFIAALTMLAQSPVWFVNLMVLIAQAQGPGVWNLKELAIGAIVVIGLVSIVYMFASWRGVVIPPIIINVFWVLLAMVVIIFMIRWFL